MEKAKNYLCIHPECLKFQKENSLIIYSSKDVINHLHNSVSYTKEIPENDDEIYLCPDLSCLEYFFSYELHLKHIENNHPNFLNENENNLNQNSFYLKKISQFLFYSSSKLFLVKNQTSSSENEEFIFDINSKEDLFLFHEKLLKIFKNLISDEIILKITKVLNQKNFLIFDSNGVFLQNKEKNDFFQMIHNGKFAGILDETDKIIRKISIFLAWLHLFLNSNVIYKTNAFFLIIYIMIIDIENLKVKEPLKEYNLKENILKINEKIGLFFDNEQIVDEENLKLIRNFIQWTELD